MGLIFPSSFIFRFTYRVNGISIIVEKLFKTIGSGIFPQLLSHGSSTCISQDSLPYQVGVDDRKGIKFNFLYKGSV